MNSASGRSPASAAKAASISAIVLALKTRVCRPMASRGCFHVAPVGCGYSGFRRIEQHSHPLNRRHQQREGTLAVLVASSAAKKIDSGRVATRPREACDKAKPDRIFGNQEHDGGVVAVALAAATEAGALAAAITLTWRRTRSAASAGSRSVLILAPAIFDRDVLALDIAALFQALAERRAASSAYPSADRGVEDIRSPASPAAARAPRAATPPPRRRASVMNSRRCTAQCLPFFR